MVQSDFLNHHKTLNRKVKIKNVILFIIKNSYESIIKIQEEEYAKYLNRHFIE